MLFAFLYYTIQWCNCGQDILWKKDCAFLLPRAKFCAPLLLAVLFYRVVILPFHPKPHERND